MIGQAVDKVKEALLEVTEEVSHYEASQKGCHYIVYAEDGEGAGVHGDNQKLLQSIEGTIDLYTKRTEIHGWRGYRGHSRESASLSGCQRSLMSRRPGISTTNGSLRPVRGGDRMAVMQIKGMEEYTKRSRTWQRTRKRSSKRVYM